MGKELASISPEPFKVTRGEEHLAKHWETRNISLAVKVCCARCNNGWMSVLENESKPLLTHMMHASQPEHTIFLSPTDPVLLARWAYKLALVGDFSFNAGKEQPGIPPSAYSDFYNSQQLPQPGCLVWTTCYGGPVRAVYGIRQTVDAIAIGYDDREIPGSEQQVFLTTFSAFRVVFQVLGYISGDSRLTKTAPERLPWLVRLWPTSGESVVWPRDRQAIGTNVLERFARRTDF